MSRQPVPVPGTSLAALVGLLGLLLVAPYHAARWRSDQALARAVRLARRRPLEPWPATPRVSILVAAWNEAHILPAHLASVRALRYPNREYILCAGGDDGSYALASRYAGPGTITVLEQAPGEGKQAALRRAFAHASGEIIFLTDADCLLDDQCFERTLQPLLRREAEAATGTSRPLPALAARSPLLVYRWAADAYVAARTPREVTGLLGRNAAVTRSALERAGAFRAAVPTGTDYHLAKALHAADVRIRFVPDSEVLTWDEGRLTTYLRQQRRWLRNVVVLGLRSGAHGEVLASLRTSLLGLGLLLVPLASLRFGPVVWSAWGVALAHGALGKLRYRAFLGRIYDAPRLPLDARACLDAVLCTLVDLVGAAWPLLDYLVPPRRRIW